MSMNHYCATVILSFLITLLSTPIVRKIAFISNFVDRPNPENPGKIHQKETALLGGLPILLGVSTTAFLLGGFGVKTVSIVSLAFLMFVVGLIDDKHGLPYRPRLLAQSAAAVIFAIAIFNLNMAKSVSGLVILGLAIIWITGITNAINLMDNIDGATTGVTALSAGTLLVVALYQRDHLPGILASALLASALAFLIFNYNPASIFLGDAGALPIGFWLAAIAVIEAKGLLYTSPAKCLAFPFILGFPIYDTTFATIRRIALKKPIYIGGESNLTYRLLSRKISKQKVVFIEYGLQAFFCAIALCIFWGNVHVASIAIILGGSAPLIIGRLLF